MIVLITFACWERRDVAVVSISALCAGDGFADVVGRRYPVLRWKKYGKSLMGSAAYFAAASCSVALFTALGMGGGVTFVQVFAAISCGMLVEAVDR